MMTKRKFLVSGYGPFGSYESNPSSVIVSELKNMEFPDDLELTFAVVDVDYAEALRCSQHACTELAVDFVVHVGVHSEPCIKLESLSFGCGYTSQDVNGRVPLLNQCELIKSDDLSQQTLKTNIDCISLANDVKDVISADAIDIRISKNPGRYLCAYIYYCSLFLNSGRSLFVHIPSFDNVYTRELQAEVLKTIILKIVERLDKME